MSPTIVRDGFEEIISHRDADTRLHAIIAIHDTTLGPALGGIRMLPYRSEDDALDDVLRLARGMTYKASLAGANLGGGKSVILGDPATEKTEDLLHAMGGVIQSLHGRYIPGIDVGTTQQDLRTVGAVVSEVSCTGEDPSPKTALGVFSAIVAAVKERHGTPDLQGRRVLVEGVGHVGGALAALLARAGADLVICDIDAEKAGKLGRQLPARVVEPSDALDIPCDVYSPCALGGTINDESLRRLDTGVVAGAANNVLAEPRHGEVLHEAGVLYAPDYCANAGGIIFVDEEMRGSTPAVIDSRIRAIGHTLRRIWSRSRRVGLPPEQVADQVAWERIEEVRRTSRTTAPAQ